MRIVRTLPGQPAALLAGPAGTVIMPVAVVPEN
jgi:hypothetical protein